MFDNQPPLEQLSRYVGQFLSHETRRRLKKNFIFPLVELLLHKERVVTKCGLTARFHINNMRDHFWFRKDFEGKFGYSIIQKCKSLESDSLVINVGAAQGYYAIFAAMADCRVIAIEPDPITNHELSANIQLNQLQDKVTNLPIACGSKNTQITLYTDGFGGRSPNMWDSKGFKQSAQIQLQRLDEIISAEQSPSLLIIDVEGFEDEVLLGMGALRPHDIFIEIHPLFLSKRGSSEQKVRDLLAQYGYKKISKPEYEKRGTELHCHYAYQGGSD